MKKWEYSKIALNEPPRGRDDVYLLCDAGEEGHWRAASRSSRFSFAGAMMTGDERGLVSLHPFFRPAPSRFPPRAMFDFS